MPLAVSVDEEGGRVSRLSSLIGATPSARVLAQTKTPDEVYQLALDRGRQMRGLGITIDFAPVVDVSNQGDDTVIGDRSFSNDPAVVTTYAGAYARGLRDAGLLPVLKHFPGHGHASGDSHKGGVVTPLAAGDQWTVDGVPFRAVDMRVGGGPSPTRVTGGIDGHFPEVKKWLADVLPNFPAYSHLLGNFDIRIDGDTATARTICFNPMVFKAAEGDKPSQILFVGIWYVDELIRTADGWRMTRRVEEKCFDKLL